ncbi:YqgE/AlgH family protein [Brevundimonas balnearis]|uniref:UPF0301 protein ACFFGE_08875 n=1 Tax=Brevundimonas balnearis TaxID=1572858 RepID=A0ABV6R2Y6_9CAUL
MSEPSDRTFTSLAGRLLVAMPGIGDPRFEHAVILICAHGPDHGMGLRIDRPAPGVDLAQVLKKLDVADGGGAANRHVLVGGPVERERGFVLHTDDWMAEDASVPFGEGLAVTATREALAAMTDPLKRPRRAVLLLGYAGWGDGQIEEELAENVWLTADADLDLIFDEDHDTKWSRALARIGVDAAWLSSDAGRA